MVPPDDTHIYSHSADMSRKISPKTSHKTVPTFPSTTANKSGRTTSRARTFGDFATSPKVRARAVGKLAWPWGGLFVELLGVEMLKKSVFLRLFPTAAHGAGNPFFGIWPDAGPVVGFPTPAPPLDLVQPVSSEADPLNLARSPRSARSTDPPDAPAPHSTGAVTEKPSEFFAADPLEYARARARLASTVASFAEVTAMSFRFNTRFGPRFRCACHPRTPPCGPPLNLAAADALPLPATFPKTILFKTFAGGGGAIVSRRFER